MKQRSMWIDGKRRTHHEWGPRNELVAPVSGTEKRQMTEMVEFCGTAGVWILILKNHKILLEELELSEERVVLSSSVAILIFGDKYRVYLHACCSS